MAKRLRALLALLAALVLLCACALGEDAQEPRALFLNVGKADAALFFVGGQTILVDTGTSDSADTLLAALDEYGVSHLDAVFVTHMHKDHVGGLKKLLKSSVTVDHVYAPKFTVYEDPTEHPAYKQATKRDIPFTWLVVGDTITVDAETSFTVLGPMTRYAESENNNSLVLYLQTKRGAMLLVGDMVCEEEQELLAAGMITHADIYKVGHHGQDDASCEELVRKVSPQIAIISTSTEERPETPSPAIVKFFRDAGTDVYVTQEATRGILVSWQNSGWVAERVFAH